MSRPVALRLGLVIIVVILLSGLGGLTAYYSTLEDPVHCEWPAVVCSRFNVSDRKQDCLKKGPGQSTEPSGG